MLNDQDNSFGFIFLQKQNINLQSSGDQGAVLEVEIPSMENALLVHSIDELNQGRKKLMRWASGGGTYVINHEWIPLVMRSDNAPTNPNKLTISSGRSDCYGEIQNPLRIIRELFEEIAILIDGSVIIPEVDLTSLDLDFNLDITETINSAIKFNVEEKAHYFYKAGLIEEIYLERLCIKSNVNIVFDKRVCLHISSDLREANFLHAVSLDDINLREAKFIDTEKSSDASGNITNLNRPIYLLNLKNNKIYGTDNGYIIEHALAQEFDFTPHAELLIARLRKVIKNAL